MSYVEVIKEAERMFRVHRRDITGKARLQFIMPARYAVYTALVLRGNSTAQVGRWLHRDHSTVIYGMRQAQRIMAADPDYRAKVEALIAFDWTARRENEERKAA